MSVLNLPILLAGLPFVLLPLLIHLINRQRHHTIRWGAMIFLRDAKRLTRGMAKLRYWLIMAMRMLAIAALVFAVSRPLASGRMGLALGGRPDTTIVILDRSASMEQQDVETGESKRAAGIRKLSELIRTLGSGTHIVLIENGNNHALPVESAAALIELPDIGPTDTGANVTAMLQTALDYVVGNQTGRTDIWVCSDLQASDWAIEDGRWPVLREGFGALEGIRFYLLSYAKVATQNLSVWVDNARRRPAGASAELVFDVKLSRPPGSADPISVPVEFVINGARSVLNVEMTEQEVVLQGHTVPLDGEIKAGWGRVDLPTDANTRDNSYYFVFGEAPERKTVIVSDDPWVAEALHLAAISPQDPSLAYSATVLRPEQVADISWETATLLLWHAPIPDGVVAQQLETFIRSGHPVMFFPPELVTLGGQLANVRWGGWQKGREATPATIESWRGDDDLLQHTESGDALPVGQLQVHRHCSIQGDVRALAILDDGNALIARQEIGNGFAYYCATLPKQSFSSLLQDGVLFYVMIQRALAIGAERQGDVHQLTAGTEAAREAASWQVLSDMSDRAPSSSRSLLAGAFQKGGALTALNRPASEDGIERLSDSDVEKVFLGVPFRHVKETVGSAASLASEVWRAFVLAMAVALVIEAWICMPARKGAKTS